MRIALAALPLAGLAGLWGWSDYQSQQGTLWDVPVMGYDPRDLLRGHYVEFRYDWPGLAAEADQGLAPERLCLFGAAPVIARVEEVADDAALAACAHPLRAAPGGIYGIEGLRQGRLYVGQDRARQLDESLRETSKRGIVRFRQRADGAITPVDIRFRPLTPAEQAAREGQQLGGQTSPEEPPALPDQ